MNDLAAGGALAPHLIRLLSQLEPQEACWCPRGIAGSIVGSRRLNE